MPTDDAEPLPNHFEVSLPKLDVELEMVPFGPFISGLHEYEALLERITCAYREGPTHLSPEQLRCFAAWLTFAARMSAFCLVHLGTPSKGHQQIADGAGPSLRTGVAGILTSK